MNDLPILAQSDYAKRINRVIDHVLQNLDLRVNLEQLAEVANFSPYHFHRIFKDVTGETLNAFVTRVRLERALYLLSHAPTKQIQEVAETCGFSSHSDFTRRFRTHYGTAPRRFALTEYRQLNRQRLEAATPLSDNRDDAPDPRDAATAPETAADEFAVTLRRYPERRIAYTRVWQPFIGTNVVAAAEALVAWAEERGLEGGQWLGYMWDDPEITELDKCRYDVGVTVPSSVAEDDVVSVIVMPAMSVATVEIRGSLEIEQRAIDWLYATWLPTSGYVPDNYPCFESWCGLPFGHGTEYFELDIELAVMQA